MNQRQVLERLETLSCLDSVRAFLSLLTLRNRLAHEYPNQLDVQASSITDAWRAIPHLLAMLDRVRDYVVSAGLVEADELPPRRP